MKLRNSSSQLRQQYAEQAKNQANLHAQLRQLASRCRRGASSPQQRSVARQGGNFDPSPGFEFAGATWVVSEMIGSGGNGQVHVARCPCSGMACAFKQANQGNDMAILCEEYETMQRLRHPNIISVFTFISTPRWVGLVMELGAQHLLGHFLQDPDNHIVAPWGGLEQRQQFTCQLLWVSVPEL